MANFEKSTLALSRKVVLQNTGVLTPPEKRQRLPLSVKTLKMAPGGVETSVFRNTTFPENANVDFSFGTPGMRIVKLTFVANFIPLV